MRIDGGIEIYFCDPRKPRQRVPTRTTTGLLRQYFPKRTDLSVHSEAVADEFNDEPRKRLQFRKPI